MFRLWYSMILYCCFLLVFQDASGQYQHGAIVRGDTCFKNLALVFTGDEYADGGMHISGVLEKQAVNASFFLTGRFYTKPDFKNVIQTLHQSGHYLGAHSNQHLLYCSWEDRDSVLVGRDSFRTDLLDNYSAMEAFGIEAGDAPFFLPPYEWYNDSIAAWTSELGLQLVNYTPGTLSHADYTVPGTGSYRGSSEILESILDHEASSIHGLNGFILLSHMGTVAEREDKFYLRLEELILELKARGYRFLKIDELLSNPVIQ